jgi:Asp-tRNA(Asn)/Glu-tRNA(Gln) amidotransferase A subunit family amidase
LILGKTNLSEWANFRGKRSTSGWSSRGGLTRNPYALDRTTCGSSSGSAAAVAANLCAAAVGTETDGSIICPAQTNGIVGIKPTVGLISRTGVIPIAHSQDTAGPMARTVAMRQSCSGLWRASMKRMQLHYLSRTALRDPREEAHTRITPGSSTRTGSKARASAWRAVCSAATNASHRVIESGLETMKVLRRGIGRGRTGFQRYVRQVRSGSAVVRIQGRPERLPGQPRTHGKVHSLADVSSSTRKTTHACCLISGTSAWKRRSRRAR